MKLRKLRKAIDATGYGLPIEVEIFNDEIWKSADDGRLELIQRRFIERVLGKQHGRQSALAKRDCRRPSVYCELASGRRLNCQTTLGCRKIAKARF